MAGDWIKMQHATMDKPEVMKMAKALSIEPEQVVGHLVRVWSWADEQSLNGHALDVTDMDIDRIARHAGFATAMREVKWLTGNPQALSFPNFDRHNGESAKKRALAADRKRRERENESRDERDDDVTREEKSRKEGNTPPITPPAEAVQQPEPSTAHSKGARRSKLELTELPDTWLVWAEQHCGTVFAVAGTGAAEQFTLFRNHHLAKGSLMADWPAAWRTWCGRVKEFGRATGGGMSKQAALEERNRAVGERWSPPEERY